MKAINYLITPLSRIGRRLNKQIGYKWFTNYTVNMDASGKTRVIFKYLGLGFFYFIDSYSVSEIEGRIHVR